MTRVARWAATSLEEKKMTDHSDAGMNAQRQAPADDRALEEFVVSALRFQGLDISLGDRDAILASARSNAAAHALVESFPMPDDVEAASVFRA